MVLLPAAWLLLAPAALEATLGVMTNMAAVSGACGCEDSVLGGRRRCGDAWREGRLLDWGAAWQRRWEASGGRRRRPWREAAGRAASLREWTTAR